MSENDLLIGGNDEHGSDPPTPGKRTPVMPFLDRSILENEFNRPAKLYFLAGAARCGFRTLDIHPELSDVSISERVNRSNYSGLSLLVTFAYNAFGSGNFFNCVSGLLTFYSDRNIKRDLSKQLAEDLYAGILERSLQKDGRGVASLGVGVLNSVRLPSALVEAGFMTNLREARLMLDPEWQRSIAEGSVAGVCSYAGKEYTTESDVTAYPQIAKGARGEYVKIAQYMLLVNGYLLDPDGIFGDETDGEVRRFQRDNMLSEDGIVGPRTWLKLLLPNPSSYVISEGSRGSEVRYAQNKLLSKLYPLGDADGIFGPRTREAVTEFQKESGLNADGIIGPLTWNALAGTSSPRDPFGK